MKSLNEQPVSHILTVDVEEYFQVGAFDRVIARSDWHRWPSRAEATIDRMIDLFARHGVHSTCFVLGWLAERYPRLVRRLAAAGHEIASHGWHHQSVTSLTPEAFRSDVRRSRHLLQQITGERVLGYRAPNFSIVPGSEWAFDVLIEEGYEYDSSLFIHRRRRNSGYPSAYPNPHEIPRPSGHIVELPIAVCGWAGTTVPASGGAYFRYLPYSVTRRAFERHGRQGTPGVFYIHPWELDPDQPRVPAQTLTRVRHYTGLRRTLPRLEQLLTDFRFASVREHPSLGFCRVEEDADLLDEPAGAA
jgi:polysaccharide deacetylase family protein (PEP-CTERM system associated)